MQPLKTYPKQRGRRLLRKLLLVLFGLLLGCFLCETGLRILGISYPVFYTTDYYRGYALRPGFEGQFQQEGGSYVRINSDGLRDRERAKTKPAGAVRIAVLGDSFTEAMHVPLEQTFCYALERKLPECNAFAGKQVEVINFGVSGYGTALELLTLRQKVWDYSPDVVLLVFTTYNDFYDNARALGMNQDVPYFIYRNGELVYDASFRDTSTYRQRDSGLYKFGRWWRDHLRIIQLIDYAYAVTRPLLTELRNQTRWRKPGDASPFWLRKEDYVEPQNENWREAWRVTEGLIVQMRNEVSQKGAHLLVVTGSNPIQVYPNAAVRQSFLRHIGQDTLFYPNHRLRALAEREQIDFMDLAEPMQIYADQNKVFLHSFGSDIGNGHWNAAGHRVVAELLAQRLCREQPRSTGKQLP